MRIIFDYEIFASQKYGGISRYFIELVNALDLLNVDAKIVAASHDNEYLKKNNGLLKSSSIPAFLLKNSFYNVSVKANYMLLKKELEKKDKTVLHETYYTHKPVENFSPVVVTVHDMLWELFLQNELGASTLIGKKKEAMKRADKIIAVSENTKDDIIKLYPEFKQKVDVVYHGVNASQFENASEIKRKPFLLFVGHRNNYKNFLMLVDVYSNSKLKDDFDLICIGGYPFSETELKKFDELKISDKVVYITANDEELASYYHSASALVYPSLYEGFGMPVLEAMAAGCAVVCAKTSSLPEVAGDFAFYFDGNEDQLLSAIEEAVTHNRNSKRLQDAKQWSAFFTWEQCALKTLDIYKSVMK